MNTIIDEFKKSETEEYSFLSVITDYQDFKTIGNNLRKLLKHEFPEIKFSVRKDYYDAYSVVWDEGHSEPQVRKITELFINSGYDGMTDCPYTITSPFIQLYGGIGYIDRIRCISEAREIEELASINDRLGKSYKMDDYVDEWHEQARTLVQHRIFNKDFSQTN